MQSLSENWIVEPLFDYEYKTYQVLGYLQNLRKHFAKDRLYPYLTELAKHLALIESYGARKEAFHDALRRELLDVDMKEGRMVRQKIEDDKGVLALLEDILAFANRHFLHELEMAEQCKNEALRKIRIAPLGVMSHNNHSGLLLFTRPKATRVYRYGFRLVRRPDSTEAYKDVVTHFLDEVSTGMFPNFSAIKGRYLRSAKSAAQPNAYLIETNIPLPQYETVLPMVKEYLLREGGMYPDDVSHLA